MKRSPGSRPSPDARALKGALAAAAAPLWIVVVLFVLSGATGLIYEVIWTRALGLLFGKTVHAASAVLAAYMGGLALGSAAGGRFVDRTRMSPLRVYGLLEAGIGIWALLLPLVVKGIAVLYTALSGPFEHLSAALSLLRFVLAVIALVPATALMGATLPALSRWAVRHESQVSSRLGLLYALNTVGGVLGCLAAGFVLLQALGLQATTLVAVAGNFVVAGIAILLARRGAGAVAQADARAAGPDAAPRGAPAAEPAASRAGRLWLVAGAIALGGFGALALEVIWFRVLLLVFGSTTYSFSAMLSVFLFGIGMGSLIATPFADRLKHPWIVLGLVQGAIGIFVLASVHAIDRLPEIYLGLMARWGLTWPHEMQAKFLLSAVLMLMPCLLSGAVWPLAVRLARPRGRTLGAEVGRLYAANTIGSILGSLAGAFLLLPLLGMQYSMMAVSVAFCAFGAALALADDAPLARRAAASIGIVVLGGLLALSAGPWDRKMLTSGAYFMPKTYIDDRGVPVLRERLKETRLLYYAEGVTTTPTVAILGDINKAFFNDGKIEGATALDGMRLQRLLGHLPLLLHRGDSRLALNIGLGSGITVGAMGVHPVERLDCAEIEPVVVGAARLFDKETFSVLDRPGLRMIYNDGRNHLMLTRDRYDAISSAPFAPLVGGAASLYSLEHFRLVRSRLAPGGMTAQFLPLYQLSPADYLTIMATFGQVFPDATVWFTGLETVLVGGDSAEPFDFETLAARMTEPKVAESLRQIGLEDPMRLLATYCFRLSDIVEDLKGVPLNTDDMPRIEFSAPRNHLVNTVKENLPWLMARRRSPLGLLRFPASWASDDPRRRQLTDRLATLFEAQTTLMEGRLETLRGDLDVGTATMEKAISMDPSDIFARELAARNLVKQAEYLTDERRDDDAIRAYERSLRWDPNHYLSLYNLARFAWERGDVPAAKRLTERALALAPYSPSLNYRMGLVLSSEKDAAGAERYLDKALDLDPTSPDPLMVLGDLSREGGDHPRASHMYRQAILLGKDDAEAHAALAQSLLDEGNSAEAARETATALARTPGYPEALYTRARLGLAQGRRQEAADDLRAAVQSGGERFRRRAMSDPQLKDLLN